METIKILEKPASISWDYDEEADVLYLSVGEPRRASGVDIGEGIILRHDEIQPSIGNEPVSYLSPSVFTVF